jgi:hypothetical protein
MLVMVRSHFLSAISCSLWFTPNNVGHSFNMSEMRLLEPTVLGVFYFCFIKGRILIFPSKRVHMCEKRRRRGCTRGERKVACVRILDMLHMWGKQYEHATCVVQNGLYNP